MTLLLDPMEELADTLGQLEDWLLFADVDTEEDGALVDRAAQAAGDLSTAVRKLMPDMPRLLSPERTELALMVSLPSEAVAAAVDAIAAGVAVLAHDPNRPATVAGTVALLQSCRAQDGTDDTVLLARVLNEGGAGGRWLGLEGETRRWTTKLGPEEHLAYRRFAGAVLDDPFLRFAATGQ